MVAPIFLIDNNCSEKVVPTVVVSLQYSLSRYLLTIPNVVNCKNCDWFYKNVMSYGVGGVGILASIVITTLLPANLGERQSAYNGAVVTSKKEVINHSSSIESQPDESQPLLPK